MIESLVLIQGSVEKEALGISLMNAKQLVIGKVSAFGVILHIASNSITDLGNAISAFAKVPGVTGVLTLALRNPQ